ncbi:deazaflavin-dependent oxidoreductase (nitroreductase family) [Haloactinospora alba]|uniref:Deazaflavin-dependent oxidoreductase (Nitroreductase family) n=1 Tax=Haloactinospora alba TaxID=405555 RepID=A0A543NIB9_9ACTN|nr:nitroreductase family deazaflavin-dependent oxidoreductase [Haloactinospora alba]TQN31586.1 deazaflavin-dependent oxidoreductase (nitroreductase family) [Haloactinospora alba]
MLFGAEHVQRYLETDGAEGHDWQGTTALVLTTTGRRSGQPRSTPLIYQRDGDSYVVVASYGGAPEHPQWYRNLVAHPTVTVQVREQRFTAHARTATPPERERLWPRLADAWPAYDDYQAKTDRTIPVVILEPTA